MAEGKKTELSIIIRAIDRATAVVKAVNDRLDKATKPIRDFKEALGDLREKSGLDDVIGGFEGVGSAIGDLLSKVAMIGGVVGIAVAGLFHLVDEFDELGDKAEQMGVSVDFLAQMRYAAEKAGAPVGALDAGLESFNVNLGKARAGTGRMTAFITKAYPPLLKQLQATKSNAEALDVLADAMSKLKDPAKRAALAQATLGDSKLAPLLAKGSKGVGALRDAHFQHAGSLDAAAEAAGKVDDSLKDLHATTDGIKAALLEGLAPALDVIVRELSDWFSAHREDIKQWAADIGKKLPGAVDAVVAAVRGAIGYIGELVDKIGGWKTVAIALAGVMLGPLIGAIIALGVALLTTPVGWIILGLTGIAAAAAFFSKGFRVAIPIIVALGAALMGMPGVAIVSGIVAAAALVIKYWEPIKAFFSGLWDGITAAFSAAWGVISGIVDKVVAAAEFVAKKVLGMGAVSGLVDQALEAGGQGAAPSIDLGGAPGGSPAEATGPSTSTVKIGVEFKNMPPGARATIDPSSTADVDMRTGHQMVMP